MKGTSMLNRIAIAAVMAVISTAAIAQSSEEQQLCMDDAFKVCSNTIPDRSRTIACMVANKSRLSPGCQMVMDKYAGGNVQTAAVQPATPARAVTSAPVRMATPVRTAARPGKPLNILMRVGRQ
jgi:hypothetical protein